jgi:hypothetical protein
MSASEYDPARRITWTAASEEVSVNDWADARTIAREHLPIEHGDARRWEHDAERIRRALALPTYAEHTLEMSCFNHEDAAQIKRRLTPDERVRVVFRYPEDP